MSHYAAALPAQAAAGATVTTLIGTNETTDDNGVYVVAVDLTPPAGFTTVTGVATNNATFNVRQLRGGSVVATFASVTLNAGTNLTAETSLNVPITAATQIARGDVFDVQQVQNGTGLAVGAGVVAQVEVN